MHQTKTYCTTKFSYPLKKKKEATFSQEPLEKHISSKRSFPYKQKSLMNLNPETLSFQRIKRIRATKWKFSPRWEQWRPKGGKEIFERAFKTLGRVAKLNKELNELFLSFRHLGFVNKELFRLAQSLKGIKSLQRFTLEGGFCEKITDKGLFSLMKALHSLKGFMLVLYSERRISDIGLNYISRGIKKMALLEIVHLNFSSLCQVTDRGVSQLNSSFNRLIRLENVILSIYRFPQITDASLENMRFGRLISLRRICFYCGENSQLTDKSIGFMTQGLKKLPNLQSITLEFWDLSEVSNLGLHYIWKMMKKLSSLKRVSLKFEYCSKITNVGFYDMKKTLKCLVMLRKFRIGFYCCPEITDNGLIDLCKVLEKGISLQTLYVSFGDCCKITDAGVKGLIDCMKTLPHLRRIGIDFSESVKVTDASLNEISQFLRSRVSLEKIILGIDVMMSGTTEKNKVNFVAEISNLKKQRPGLRIKYRK